MTDPTTPRPGYPATPAYGAPQPGAASARGASGRTPLAAAPDSAVRWALALAVAQNLLAMASVLFFGWPPGNVFLLFWVENAVLGVCTLVKVLTAQGPSTSTITVNGRPRADTPGLSALFFCVHYGIFCLVHLAFSLVVAIAVGLEPTFLLLGLPVLLLLVRYAVETVQTWFGPEGQRFGISPSRAMVQPYPRIIVLHLAVLGAFALVITGATRSSALGGWQQRLAPVTDLLPAAWQTQGVLVVALLLAVKTVVDVATLRWVLRPRARSATGGPGGRRRGAGAPDLPQGS